MIIMQLITNISNMIVKYNTDKYKDMKCKIFCHFIAMVILPISLSLKVSIFVYNTQCEEHL